MARRLTGLLSVMALCAFAYGCGGGSDTTSTTALTPQEVIESAKPATVELFGKVGDSTVGGSGVVYDAANGRILTNAHVVEGVSQLKVKVGDQLPTLPARVVGQAPCDDLAVVQLGQLPPDLAELPLGDSATVENGDHVTVLGYPSGFQRAQQQAVSTTEGTVSNPSVIGNQISADLPRYQSLIQHQAPVNPGNSGGPLVDDQGDVIGINALTSAPEGNQGQYFAISINQAKSVLPQLEAGDNPAYIGLSTVPLRMYPDQALAADFAYQYGSDVVDEARAVHLSKRDYDGLYVLSSELGSPARRADIFPGDLIERIDGTRVTTVPKYCSILRSAAPGQTLAVDTRILTDGKQLDDVFGAVTVKVKVPEEAVSTPVAPTTTTSSTSTTSTPESSTTTTP